jgi:hypothetical protein
VYTHEGFKFQFQGTSFVEQPLGSPQSLISSWHSLIFMEPKGSFTILTMPLHPIQSTPSQPISLTPTLILYFYLHVSLISGLYFVCISQVPECYISCPSHPSGFNHPNNTFQKAKGWSSLFLPSFCTHISCRSKYSQFFFSAIFNLHLKHHETHNLMKGAKPLNINSKIINTVKNAQYNSLWSITFHSRISQAICVHSSLTTYKY